MIDIAAMLPFSRKKKISGIRVAGGISVIRVQKRGWRDTDYGLRITNWEPGTADCE